MMIIMVRLKKVRVREQIKKDIERVMSRILYLLKKKEL